MRCCLHSVFRNTFFFCNSCSPNTLLSSFVFGIQLFCLHHLYSEYVAVFILIWNTAFAKKNNCIASVVAFILVWNTVFAKTVYPNALLSSFVFGIQFASKKIHSEYLVASKLFGIQFFCFATTIFRIREKQAYK